MTSRQKPRLQAGFGTETPTEDADERVSNAGGEEETSEEPRPGGRRASETPKNKAARLSAQVSSLEPRQTTRIIITAKSTFHEG